MNLNEYCKNRDCLNCKIQKTIYTNIENVNESTKHKILDIVWNTITICNCYKENNIDWKFNEKIEKLTDNCWRRLLFILLNQSSFEDSEEWNTKENLVFIDSIIQKRSYFRTI